MPEKYSACVDCGTPKRTPTTRPRCNGCSAIKRSKEMRGQTYRPRTDDPPPFTHMDRDDPRHGTPAGYAAHRRTYKEQACEDCRDAERGRQSKKLIPCPGGCGRQCHAGSVRCRSCAQKARAEWEDLDPVTDWVMARSPSGHFILRRAS